LATVTGALPSEDPRDAVIREQAERLALQDEQIAGHAERIAVLEAVVADLRERLESALRAGSRNSGNSSVPPSMDDQPGRKPPRRERRAAERAAGKRKQGKQPGSPGASMMWEVPDRTEDHFPEGACPCGADLAEAADLGTVRSFQQEEVPAASAERVQHDLHEVRCACGLAKPVPRPLLAKKSPHACSLRVAAAPRGGRPPVARQSRFHGSCWVGELCDQAERKMK